MKPDDGVIRHDYGLALLEVGRNAEAETQFREAVRLEPHWAIAYYNLATALQHQGEGPEAIAQYEAFLARCPRRMSPLVAEARNRIGALKAAAP
jgi:Flp pilus assembly protein TadD